MMKTLVAFLASGLLLSLFVQISFIHPATAAPEDVKWERVNIPAGGETGGWVLAAGSDVKHLTVARDGTLYAYANPTGASSKLFKSTDSGFSWTATGDVTGTITGIATAPDDANIVYYATASSVHKSADAGKTFAQFPAGPGGAGTGNIAITSIAVARLDGKRLIAIGTADSDNLQYGGIYTLDESRLMPVWENANVGNYDVSAVVFSPNYSINHQLAAAITDETDTFISTRIGSGGWDQVFGRATIAGRVATSAALAFPDDYDVTGGDFTFFVGIDTGGNNGDVFKIRGKWAPDNSIATDLNIGAVDNLSNVDITGLAMSDNGSAVTLLAGAAASTRIYLSIDGGANWKRSRKEPTGQSKTYLLSAPGSADSRIAYAATSGTDSAFSLTTDGGLSWNQTGLIDARISSNGIIDLAVSHDYQRDKTLFILTFDSVITKHSLWRNQSEGAEWERVFSGTLANVNSLSKVRLSPQYGSGSQTVFLAGSGFGNPALWRSADDGQTFTYRTAPATIDTWTVIDDDSLFFGSFNGTNGVVYSTDNGGFFFSSGTASGTNLPKSIAASPNYKQDKSILVGNSNGWVYRSTDNGVSFKPVPQDATSPPLAGSIMVSFDPQFAANNIIYAASNSANQGVYRFVIGKSTKWERIDSTLPTGATLGQIILSADGTLYAVNSQAVDTSATKGGMERSLNPSYTSGPTFETVIRGLDNGVNLSGLWVQGNQFWSIDTSNTRVMTFVDSLARPVTQTFPADRETGTGTANVNLRWEPLSGATEYKWQFDYDTDFSAVPSGFDGDTKASSVRLPSLESDTTYYWRVRATKPLLSRWSEERSFTTGLSAAVAAPELYSPKAGAEGVSINPLFQWSAISGASSYELVVSSSVTFDNPIISKTGADALPATAWQSDITLAYSTAYYWKVRASSAGSQSAWSAVGTFITQSEPNSPQEEGKTASPPQPSSPAPPTTASTPATPPNSPPPAQPAFPEWFPYLIGALLLVIVILLGTLLVLLVVTLRRG